MTPKEKAFELVEKFIKTNGNSFFAKDCAIIAVDEIIDTLKQIPESLVIPHHIKFWQEVKQELENLKN
jgi:hypothetical protein